MSVLNLWHGMDMLASRLKLVAEVKSGMSTPTAANALIQPYGMARYVKVLPNVEEVKSSTKISSALAREDMFGVKIFVYTLLALVAKYGQDLNALVLQDSIIMEKCVLNA